MQPRLETWLGETGLVHVDLTGAWQLETPRPLAVLPGSFNPVHAGHWGLAEAAAEILGRDVHFELSLANVDKPELSVAEAQLRAAQFQGRGHLWLTRAPRFRQKARLFPGATFIVGADTALRLVSPQYYQGDRETALAELVTAGCHVLVASRADPQGRCLSLADIEVPAAFRSLFLAIPESRFRLDVSSTEVRGQCSEPRP